MSLDDAYANAKHIPDSASYPPRWTAEAERYRAQLSAEGRAELDIAYGDSPRQAFDLFHPEGQPRGLVIFVHGGYWLRFGREVWSHFAHGALVQGWAVAMPSYDLCPHVDIATITRQIARAVGVLAARFEGPIVLTGHSAGGHLVARMAVPGVLPDAVAARICRVVSISPVSDLRPLMQTAMNADFGLTEQSARAESPALMRPRDLPVTVWVGGAELPAFLDQARWLAEAWGADLIAPEGQHHFSVIEPLEDPQSALVQRICGVSSA